MQLISPRPFQSIITKKPLLCLALLLALSPAWVGVASATIVALGPFANTARWPAAAKVNAFYGNPETVFSFGIAQEVDYMWGDNHQDFDSSNRDSTARIGQESVFAIVGTFPGKWKLVFMLTHWASWSQGNEGGGSAELGLERAYVDYKIPWFKTWWITVGNHLTSLGELDPLIFASDNHGISLRGRFNKELGWTFRYLKINEDLDCGGISVGVNGNFACDTVPGAIGSGIGPLGAANAGTGRGGDNDHDAWIGSLDWKPGKQRIAPYFLWNRKHFPDPLQLNQIFVGFDTRLKIGPLRFETKAVYMGGDIELEGPGNGFDGDLGAYFLKVEAQWPLGKWTPHLGVSYASGDDDPADDDLEGFGLANDLVVPPKRGWGVNHRFTGGGGETPRGLGFFASRKSTVDWALGAPIFASTCTGPSVRAPQGGPHTICKGPKRSSPFNKVLGPNAAFPDGINADGTGLQNPGLWVVNLGLDWRPTKQLFFDTNLSYMAFVDGDEHFETSLFRRADYVDDGRPGATVGGAPVADDFDNDIGWDLSVGGTWRQSRNFFIEGSIAALIPSSGAIEQIYGDDDVAWRVALETHWRF